MKIQVRGQHLDVTEALRQYVEKKIGRLEKYFNAPSVHTVSVTLSVVKDLHAVEVTMPINGYVIRAEEKSSDMYASIDTVSDKLEKQIEKHKSKINKRLKQEGIHSLFVEAEAAVALAPTVEADSDLVRVKRFAVKPMDVDEAIMQMDLLGHDFFVFSNADSEEVNVVYRRKDGAYGLIEPSYA
ncbi:MAG TPA: ribosome-associated translation inhibitor RaiA [Bacilli bacterium]|nr:ribosome-associated translation inhibitor RaiA [Bacilli bacterium]